jgi:hypothetical protein
MAGIPKSNPNWLLFALVGGGLLVVIVVLLLVLR